MRKMVPSLQKANHIFWFVLTSVLLLPSGQAFSAQASENSNIEDVLVVHGVQADLQSSAPTISATGVVSAKREIDLAAQVSGVIVSTSDNFASGLSFQKGEKILMVEDVDYIFRKKRAESILAQSELHVMEEEAASFQAEREWHNLGSDKSNDIFLRKPHLRAAKAALQSAKAELVLATLNLQKTSVLSPFDALVVEVYKDKGQFVSVGTPIAKIYDKSIVEIKVNLTEKQASLIDLPFYRFDTPSNPPSNRISKPSAVDVKVTADVATRKHAWQGYINRMSPYVDHTSRVFQVYVEVANPFDHVMPLLPGLFVDVEIPGRELSDVFVLPRSAVFNRDKIYVYDENKELKKYHVDILHKTQDKVWIHSDMPTGSIVLVDGQLALSPQKPFKLELLSQPLNSSM